MEENKTKFGIIFATILLFVALVVLILYLIPKISQLRNLSNQVEAKRVEYESGKIKVLNAEDLKKFIGQSQSEAKLLGVALPSTSSAEDALLELSSAASSVNLQVLGAQVQDDGKGNLFVNFSTRGTFENSVGFLDKLKSNIRPAKIVDLDMNKADEDVITNLNLDFPYYLAAAPSATPSASKTAGEATK